MYIAYLLFCVQSKILQIVGNASIVLTLLTDWEEAAAATATNIFTNSFVCFWGQPKYTLTLQFDIYMEQKV